MISRKIITTGMIINREKRKLLFPTIHSARDTRLPCSLGSYKMAGLLGYSWQRGEHGQCLQVSADTGLTLVHCLSQTWNTKPDRVSRDIESCISCSPWFTLVNTGLLSVYRYKSSCESLSFVKHETWCFICRFNNICRLLLSVTPWLTFDTYGSLIIILQNTLLVLHVLSRVLLNKCKEEG